MASTPPPESGISRTITGSLMSPTVSEWLTPSASRNGRLRKKSSLAAASPRSSRSSAFTVGKTGEVLGQQAPDLVVDRLVVPPDRLALEALLAEPQVCHNLLGGLVGRGDLGVDPMGAQLAERVYARLALGLPRDPLAPRGGIAHQHRELGPDVAVEPEEGDEADRLVRAVDRDRPFSVARGVHRPLDPPLRVVLAEAVAAADEVGRDALVVEPAMDRVRVAGPEVSKGHVRCHRALRIPVQAVAGDQQAQGPREDAQVEAGRAMLDVPDVQLDPLLPGDPGAAVDLSPSRDAGRHVQPAALMGRVQLDLRLQGRARADDGQVAAEDVEEVRQLVEREPAQ